MLSNKLLINNNLSKLPKYKQREFLLNCITKNYDKFNLIDFKEDTSSTINNLLCKICNSSDFYIDKHEEICNNCGFSKPIESKTKSYEKYEFIKPGSNIVKIIKDGKTISVDLNRINLWLQDSDPFYKEINLIKETVNIIFDSKGLLLPENILNYIISLYINFNSLLNKLNNSEKPSFNKKAIIALCIYYGCDINSINVSLQQLSILFNIPISIIYSNNNIMKQIFKNTEYLKYFNLSSDFECNIDLSFKNKLLFNKIKLHLKDNFNLNDPIDNKYYAAIIYYITNNINKVRKYTLHELSNYCKISEPSISVSSKNIDRFYKLNPKLFRDLI